MLTFCFAGGPEWFEQVPGKLKLGKPMQFYVLKSLQGVNYLNLFQNMMKSKNRNSIRKVNYQLKKGQSRWFKIRNVVFVRSIDISVNKVYSKGKPQEFASFSSYVEKHFIHILIFRDAIGIQKSKHCYSRYFHFQLKTASINKTIPHQRPEY